MSHPFSIAQRSNVEPFHAMDVLAEAGRLAAKGHPVVSLAVGQPSHPAPASVLNAAADAVSSGSFGYTQALGRPELREAIARDYAEKYGVSVNPDCVAVTTGSSAAFTLAFLSLFEPGDRVAITRPGYPAYRNILQALGLEVLEVPLSAETNFTLMPESLNTAKQTYGRIAGVLLASPANPTGTVTGRQDFENIIKYCNDEKIAFISDEIYHGLTFEGDETSALEISDDTIIINSFSKYYCMTGWRIGWMVLPHPLVRVVERLAQSLYISAPDLSQIAATKAFMAKDEMNEVAEGYRQNRSLLAERLPAMGLPFASPSDGAFYAYVDVSSVTNDSMDFAREMLSAIHVAATPGLDFDPIDGHRTLRLSYAGSHDDMITAMDRMERWLRSRG